MQGGLLDTPLSTDQTYRFNTTNADIVLDLSPEPCSDGMSDMAYGLTVRMLELREGDTGVFYGCCSVAP